MEDWVAVAWRPCASIAASARLASGCRCLLQPASARDQRRSLTRRQEDRHHHRHFIRPRSACCQAPRQLGRLAHHHGQPRLLQDSRAPPSAVPSPTSLHTQAACVAQHRGMSASNAVAILGPTTARAGMTDAYGLGRVLILQPARLKADGVMNVQVLVS